jgi:hypothetical protein
MKKAISSWLAMMCNLKTNMVPKKKNFKINNKTSHKNQSGHQSQWLKIWIWLDIGRQDSSYKWWIIDKHCDNIRSMYGNNGIYLKFLGLIKLT